MVLKNEEKSEKPVENRQMKDKITYGIRSENEKTERRLLKMKTTKRISVIVVILLLAVTVSVTSFAVSISSDGITSAGGNELKFTKSILMKNGNSSKVREPNITYTYTITEIETLSTNETVTDAIGNVGTVYKLSTEGGTFSQVLPTNTATAVFSDVNVADTSTNGVERSIDLTFTFDASKFPHAGIYRFKVAETSDVTKASVGIAENNNYASTMYLDVYVQGQGNDTSIYAYVLFENNDAAITNATKAARQKSSGWSGGDTGTVNQDIYQTYDLEVKKEISGDATSQNHRFPFAVTLTNGALSTKVDLAISANNAEYGATPSSDAVGNYIALSSTGAVVNAKLANNGTVTITGIPASTKATVQETNDTYDFYSLSATVDGSTTTDISAAAGSVAPNGGVSTITPAINIDGATTTRVLFGNNLTTISPTGYVSRYAPYGLILIAGVVLLVIARKHKKHTDED